MVSGIKRATQMRRIKGMLVDVLRVMGAPVEETTVLNRANLSEYKLIDNCWVWTGR